MGNESSSSGGASSSDKRQPPSSAAAGSGKPHQHWSVNRPIGSDSSPPQSSFNLHAASPTAASSTNYSANRAAGTADDGKHRIVVVNSGPRPDSAGVSDEVRALATLPTFMPLIRSTASASGHASDSSALPPSADRVDHRSLLHFCARYQEHLKQCAEAVAFDQNSLCGRIKELEVGAKSIQDSLQDRHKKFQKLAEQIHKVTELRSLLARMRSHAKHLGALMEELNSALPADCQLEPFSWQSTLPQQQSDGAPSAAQSLPD